MNTAPPSPYPPKFFDGKKLVHVMSAIEHEFLFLILEPKFCAASSICIILFILQIFFSFNKLQLLPNKEVEITAKLV